MGEKKNKGGDGGKKNDDGSITVVLKVDMHCEGCANKFKGSARGFEGVEQVKADYESNKLTVIGKVDPAKIRERLEQKTKKKVELISPLPKKDKEGGGGEGDKKAKDNKPPEKKAEDKKPKEPTVTTGVMKVSSVHCEGCVKKIKKTIKNTKGFVDMDIDQQKDLVTVKGTMDMKVLAESLKKKLRRPVELVPPKKEGGGEKKDGGGEKGKGGGDGGKKEGGGGGKAEGNKMDFYGPGYGYGTVHGYGYEPGPGYGPEYGYGPVPGYGPGYGPGPGPGYVVEQLHHPMIPIHSHPPQMFSDENPNACSIM